MGNVQKANELWTCYALVKCAVTEGESKAILNTSVGGNQLMAPTITTGLKPLSLVVFKVILQPSFIQQLHKVTFPIKPKQFCSFSALPIFNERPQQCWRRHYNTNGQCQFPQQSLPRTTGHSVLIQVQSIFLHQLSPHFWKKYMQVTHPWQKENTTRSVPGWPQSQY